MPIVRLARASDLPSLLALFAVSEVSASAVPAERAEDLWRETLAQPGVHVFVSCDCQRIAATCMLITAPNLLRGGRRHALLENVVSHPEMRGQGHGKAVVQAALAHAWASDCHHVMMQSGRVGPHGSMLSTKPSGSSRGFGSPTWPGAPAEPQSSLSGPLPSVIAMPHRMGGRVV